MRLQRAGGGLSQCVYASARVSLEELEACWNMNQDGNFLHRAGARRDTLEAPPEAIHEEEGRRRVRVLRLGAFAVAGALVLTAISLGGPALTANAASGYTCGGGSVPAGTYASLTVTGVCTVDAGNVTVEQNIVIKPGAALLALFAGSDLTVGGNVLVAKNAAAGLGCGPPDGQCANDQGESPTLSNNVRVAGNVVGTGALAVIIHNITVGRNVVIAGGGGGVNCHPHDIVQGPAFSDVEDSTIGGNVVVSGLQSCWLGFIRNHVSGNAIFTGNTLADPDANEFVTNTIGRNLICVGNSPAPQYGDSGGDPDVVGGRVVGQCEVFAHPNPNPGGD